MTAKRTEAPPARGTEHEALAVFLGDWTAEGLSYGGTDQSGADPKANGVRWTSRHTARWHTGQFFLIQDERACPGGEVFDTLSIMSIDEVTGRCFARCFENHGFYRRYDVIRDGSVWILAGASERARIEFVDDRTQVITWEWKPADRWLPLCDRTARRID